MKPENWLRIDLSGDWCLCIVVVVQATIGLCPVITRNQTNSTLSHRCVCLLLS